MKKALILTNQMTKFAGSEIVALEVAESLHELDFSVDIRTNALSRRVASSTAEEINFSDTESLIDLAEYDFVWMQHNLTHLFDLTLASKGNANARVLSVHLSPYEHLELTGLSSGLALGARFVCNSWETQQKLISLGIDAGELLNFKNAAPQKFFRVGNATSTKLDNLLVVSNHLPSEVNNALSMLEREGVVVRRLGMRHEQKRVTPEDIFSSSAILSIGKTVQYGILAGIPVFCYDRFGGPGWLCRQNFDVAARYNFSGRCCQRKLTPKEIHQSLKFGYDVAREEAFEIKKIRAEDFILENFLHSILSAKTSSRQRTDTQNILLSCAAANSKVLRDLYRRVERRKRLFNIFSHFFSKIRSVFWGGM